MIPYTQIRVIARDQSSQRLPGARVTLRLSGFDRDAGFITPRPAHAVTDAEGEAIVHLWPNTRGLAGTQYIVTIIAPGGGRTLVTARATIPESETVVDLDAVTHVSPPPPVSDAQAAQEAAQLAAAEAAGSAQAAEDAALGVGSAVEAAQAAAVAAGNASGVAEGAADAASTAATSAAGSSLSAGASAESAGSQASNAADSATAASVSAGSASDSAASAAQSVIDAAEASRLTAGEVDTLPAGSAAQAEITGDPGDQVLGLGIPAGAPGQLTSIVAVAEMPAEPLPNVLYVEVPSLPDDGPIFQLQVVAEMPAEPTPGTLYVVLP